MEQGGECAGGLEQEAGAWGGCVELGCFEEKWQVRPTLASASSEEDSKFPTPFLQLRVNRINQTDKELSSWSLGTPSPVPRP